MLNLSNYQAIERINESDNTIVFQGRRISDNLPVIIKLPKNDHPAPEESARYSHEFKILSSLNFEGVVKTIGLELYDNRRGIILEDFGGTALSKLMLRRTFAVDDFLAIAIKITKALLAIHSSFIIHKDINPSNIVLNEDSGQLKLIDFGISSELSHEAANHGSIKTMEGTLAYISPEQTGRMNRTLDYRTDFYSLGVTLYEIVCQRLPFIANDVLELVHSHIAKNPIPPNRIRLDLPQQISDLIMKLLQKNADERYQSAGGILHDLEECARQREAFGHINPFPLARNDISDRLNVGQKLYGRETETNALLEAYDRVAHGGSEAFLISGAAGLGKSSLVREASKNILLNGARFVSGKFDQLNDGVPYKALLDAFQELIRQLLCEDEPKLVAWKDILQKALSPNGALLVAVIPELEQIIGVQPAAPKLPPLEAQNRFRLVFQNFIKAFCLPQQPLVIFLDDLQWGCSASYDLLRDMMTDPLLKHLLLISAFREAEVDAIHPLTACLDYWRKEGVTVSRIALAVLGVDHISKLLADSLSAHSDEVSALAALLSQKTGGNPFFVGMFLHSLYRDNLLWINKAEGRWQWNLEKIQSVGITENVVTLLSDKIGRLLPKTQQALQLAGTIGNKFDLQLLSMLLQKSMSETVAALQEAVDEGLIVPFGDTYKLIGLPDPDIGKGESVYFRFLHDRIQKVAYSLLSEQQRQTAHYAIGQQLLRELPAAQQDGKIFDIANHLNKAGPLVAAQAEKEVLARLNAQAGVKAKNSAAWHVAHKHFQLAIDLLGSASWEKEYGLTLEMHIEGAESAYLCGKFAAMELLIQAVLDHGRTLLDKVRVYEVKIQAYKAQYQIQKAIEVALPVLAMLGFKFQLHPSKLQIALGLHRVKLALLGKDIEGLADLPAMHDPIGLAAIRIMNSVGSAAYFVAPNLTPLLVFTAVRLIVKHGNVPESAFLFAVYGMISCGVLGKIGEGYRLGQLALRLLHSSEVRALKAKTIHMVNAFTLHWQNHLRDTLNPLLGGYHVGLETGDNEYAGYCAFFYCSHSFIAGKVLAELDQEMAAYDNALLRLKYSPSIYMQKIFHQAVVNLQKRSYQPGLLQGDIYDEQLESALHLKATDRSTLFFLNFTKLYLAYLFHDFNLALAFASQTETYLDGIVGSVFVPLFHYYDSLASLAVVPATAKLARQKLLDKVAANQKKMQGWAKHAPMNFRHKYLLVEAERLRILGQDGQASECYDQAICLARESEYLNDEALANELAARFYLDNKRPKIAGAYMQDARYCFLQWGATAKVASLDEEYRKLLPVELISKQTMSKNLVLAAGSTTMSSDAEFDLASVMKVSQAISGEIVLGNLLKQMMKILIENAGAQFGYLIMKSGEQLRIEAEGALENADITVLQSLPVDASPAIAAGIVHYVDRTREYVVLENALEEGHFTHDPFVVQHRPKSILCLPLIHKSKFIGILYLGNNAMAGAFTVERLKMLRLLSSQIAISLENANLFADLESSETRYRELYENIIDIVLLMSSEGAISMANPLFYSMFGLHREDTQALDFKRMVHPDDMAMIEERLLVKLNTSEVVKDLQFRMVGVNREVFDVECNAKCLRNHAGAARIQMVVRDVTDRKRLEKDLFDSLKDAQNAKKGTILGLAKLAEYRDKDTGSHLERIREYARVITEELSTKPTYQGYISQRYIDDIYLSSILHDIGKVGIPDAILLKNGALTEREFDEMKRHPTYGGDALSAVESQVDGESFIALGKTIAYYHHEKWDGSGYPYGLQGEDIPLSTRIVALVDVYDALTSKRSYKDAFSHAQAKEIIFAGKGKHFAPDVVDAFFTNENRFIAIRKELLN